MGTLPKSSEVSVEVEATPEQVWALLTDVTRAGEWSHESTGGEWLGGATGPAVGARWRGRNESGRYRWARECEVLELDGPRRFRFRTHASRIYRDSTEWTYDLEPTATGCRITQRYQVLHVGPIVDRLLYLVVPAHRDRSAALAEDVRRLGARAAGTVAA